MIIEYKTSENDFLIHQLYLASISERIRKKRQRNKIIVPIIYSVIGIVSFFLSDFAAAIVFFIIAILWFFLYPLREKRRYIKHYQSFINETYKERIGRLSIIEFNNDFIIAKDEGSESKILTKEFEEIVELSTIILLKLKGGQSLILPKKGIENIDVLIVRLKELADYLKISYVLNENWAWN